MKRNILKLLAVFCLLVISMTAYAQEDDDARPDDTDEVADTTAKKELPPQPTMSREEIDSRYNELKVDFMKDYDFDDLQRRIQEMTELRKEADKFVKFNLAYLSGPDGTLRGGEDVRKELMDVSYRITKSISIARNKMSMMSEDLTVKMNKQLKKLKIDDVYSFEDSSFIQPKLDQMMDEMFYSDKTYDFETHAIGTIIPNALEVGITETQAKCPAFGYKVSLGERHALWVVKIFVGGEFIIKPVLWDIYEAKAVPENRAKVDKDVVREKEIDELRLKIKDIAIEDVFDFSSKEFVDVSLFDNMKKNMAQLRKEKVDFSTHAIGTILKGCEEYGVDGKQNAFGYKIKLKKTKGESQELSDYYLLIVVVDHQEPKVFLCQNTLTLDKQSNIVDAY